MSQLDLILIGGTTTIEVLAVALRTLLADDDIIIDVEPTVIMDISPLTQTIGATRPALHTPG